MHNPSDENGESEFQERTEMLEEMLKDPAKLGAVGYSLVIDELGIEPRPDYRDYYNKGIESKSKLSGTQIEELKVNLRLIEAKPKKRQNLRAIAESYSREDETRAAPAKSEERIQPKSYTIAQHDNDKGIVGYYKVKHPNLRNYEDAKIFLETFGTSTLNIKGGEPRPLKECDPSRVIAAAIGKYGDAQRRLKEKEDGLREIVNGTP
jgi:hypothetical protein